jgi:lipoprotein-releasing system ATP-binding protein
MSKAKPTPTPVADTPKEKAGEVVLRGVDLRKTFVIRKDLPALQVLQGLDIEVRAGECLSIIGESGVGKSTLLHILGLLDCPSSGQVFYRGQDVTSLSRVEQARVRNRALGFVFQFYHLLPDLDALENAMLPGMIRHGYFAWRRSKRAVQERAEHLMEQVGLAERLFSRPSQLSGGEQQRVALVRALLNEPEVLLCDEPTGNLDPRTAAGLRDLLFELKDNLGLTIVLVTHNQDLASRADRTVRIVDGKILG